MTVTAPESKQQTREQDQIRDGIENDPARAAKDRKLPGRYKAPVFVNNNIHGNEWRAPTPPCA